MTPEGTEKLERELEVLERYAGMLSNELEDVEQDISALKTSISVARREF